MNGAIRVLQLVKCVGRIDGRKKFQKIVHILQSMGVDFPQSFGYLHYGPYSSELAAQIDMLTKAAILAEEQQTGEFETYHYRPGEALDSTLNSLNADGEPEWAALARQLSRKDARELETISTIFYLQRCGFSGSALTSRFAELKPHLANKLQTSLSEVESLTRAAVKPK